MSVELVCKACSKHMGTLRDAKVRNGMVVYCRECDEAQRRMLAMANCYIPSKADVPDFLKELFR